MTGTTQARWIAADWGTSRLRVWAMDGTGAVLAEAQSDRGMGKLAPPDFEPALLALIDPWLAPGTVTPVLVCGMAGARQGWAEAPYQPVPCLPVGRGAITVPTRDPRLDVRILPGLSQSDLADVMRGEETQIAGFLSAAPGFEGTLCLPGTHSKWVQVAGGRVTGFRTAMTGELFALIGQHSVLRHSLDEGWDDSAFDAAVTEALAEPASVLATLFSLRATALLRPYAPSVARARLSGLLIGAELAGMRAFWAAHRVTLIGDAGLTRPYARALALAGGQSEQHDGSALALAGLAAAHALLEEIR